MNRFELVNKVLILNCQTKGYHTDIPWSLSVEQVQQIGFVNKMDGDDDSDFLVFITKDLKKRHLSLNRLENYAKTVELIEQLFSVNIHGINIKDQGIYIYPKSEFGKPLYKKSLIKWLRINLGFDHVADGDLNRIEQ